jgi:hypothetical protein
MIAIAVISVDTDGMGACRGGSTPLVSGRSAAPWTAAPLCVAA